MKQIKLVLNIDGLDPSGIEVKAGTIITGLTGNANLPNTATIYVPLLTSAKNALNDAIHAEHPDTLVIIQAKSKVVKVLNAIKASVELECNNNDVIAASCGLELKQNVTIKPKVFTAVQGTLSGTVNLTSPYAGSHAAYVWEMSSDPISTWSLLKITNNTSCTISDLVVGNKYWFRVKAIVYDVEQPYTAPHMVHVV